MSTIQEVEMLATLLRVLDGKVPTDAELLARVAAWRKQLAAQLKRAADRYDTETP